MRNLKIVFLNSSNLKIITIKKIRGLVFKNIIKTIRKAKHNNNNQLNIHNY